MDDRVKSAWIHRSVRCSKRFFCHVFRRWQGTVLDRNRIFLNQAKRITLERGLQKRLHDGRAVYTLGRCGWQVHADRSFYKISCPCSPITGVECYVNFHRYNRSLSMTRQIAVITRCRSSIKPCCMLQATPVRFLRHIRFRVESSRVNFENRAR